MDFDEVMGSPRGPNNAVNPPSYASNGFSYPTQQTAQAPPPPPPYSPQLPGYQQQPLANDPDIFRNYVGSWKIEHQTGYKEYMRVRLTILKSFQSICLGIY